MKENAMMTTKRLMHMRLPCLLTFDEKHGDDNWLIRNLDDIRLIFLKKFNERVKAGWFEKPNNINDDDWSAYNYLNERIQGEYEYFTFKKFNNV